MKAACTRKLAEAVPSLDNGLWKLFPITWRRHGRCVAGPSWHRPGAPVTGDDFVFATVVDLDEDFPSPSRPAMTGEAPSSRPIPAL